jgi:hypothetical protein
MMLYRGREIDRTDGFFLLFDDAGDAARYALEYHKVLNELEIKFGTNPRKCRCCFLGCAHSHCPFR